MTHSVYCITSGVDARSRVSGAVSGVSGAVVSKLRGWWCSVLSGQCFKAPPHSLPAEHEDHSSAPSSFLTADRRKATLDCSWHPHQNIPRLCGVGKGGRRGLG